MIIRNVADAKRNLERVLAKPGKPTKQEREAVAQALARIDARTTPT